MAVTTVAAIRDRMTTVIAALSPTVLPGNKFVAHRQERDGDFIGWAQEHPAAAFRRFSVRKLGEGLPPTIASSTEEEQNVIFQIEVAYPQTHRTGPQNALDRDDAMDSDEKLIRNAVGLYGGANFQLSNPNATFRGDAAQQLREPPCDFLVITQTMSFIRSV